MKFPISLRKSAAQQHEQMDPEKVFWEEYERTYARFDGKKFKEEVIDRIEDDYFSLNTSDGADGCVTILQVSVFVAVNDAAKLNIYCVFHNFRSMLYVQYSNLHTTK